MSKIKSYIKFLKWIVSSAGPPDSFANIQKLFPCNVYINLDSSLSILTDSLYINLDSFWLLILDQWKFSLYDILHDVTYLLQSSHTVFQVSSSWKGKKNSSMVNLALESLVRDIFYVRGWSTVLINSLWTR